MDKDTLFFVAEATKTTYLSNTQQVDEDGNNLWVGCDKSSKAGRICEVRQSLASTPYLQSEDARTTNIVQPNY